MVVIRKLCQPQRARRREYYIIRITNFNGQEGFIRMVQTNYAEPGCRQNPFVQADSHFIYWMKTATMCEQ
jgi:hypothetical protein